MTSDNGQYGQSPPSGDNDHGVICNRSSFSGLVIGAPCDGCGHSNVAHDGHGCIICRVLAESKFAHLRDSMAAFVEAMRFEGVHPEQRRRVTTRLLYGNSCLCTIDTRDVSIVDREAGCPRHGRFVDPNEQIEMTVVDCGAAERQLLASASAEMRADYAGVAPAMTELYRRAGLLPADTELHQAEGTYQAVSKLPAGTGARIPEETPLVELERPELRWHYGPTETDPNPGAMWHYDCGGEVWYIDDAPICSRCDQQGPEGQA
jgi:hypothetical protein